MRAGISERAKEGMAMRKKIHEVRLTDEQRALCERVATKCEGPPERVRRAWILLKSDGNGKAWLDARIAESYGCSVGTVERVRRRFAERGFEAALERARQSRTRPKALDGEQEARVVALRLGSPPAGYSRWSLRLLARKAVELGIVDRVSHETMRKTVKKTASRAGSAAIG